MHFQKLISVLTLSSILFTVCAAAEESIAVRVGDVKFSAETLSRDIETIKTAAEQSSGFVEVDTVKEIVDEVVEDYVTRGIVEMMLRDAGQWEIDENTEYSLQKVAQQQYDAYWDYFRNQPEMRNFDDAEITNYLNESGITLDLSYEEAARGYHYSKLLSLNDIKVEVTDADVDAYYEENIVAPYRERYENNVPLYEEEVLSSSNATNVYAPEGYRQLMYISFPIPEDIADQLNDCAERAEEYITTANEAYQSVAAMAMNGEDVTEMTETYRTAMAAYDEIEVEYGRLRDSILPALKEATDEVYARLLSGETFDSILGNVSASNIFIYHKGSKKWPDSIMTAANSLEQIGDVSDPAITTDGVFILYYYGDIPGGTIPLDDKTRESMRNLTETQYYTEAIADLTQAHRDDYEIVIDLSSVAYAN